MKKYILYMIALLLAFSALAPAKAHAGFKGWITELSFDETGGEDWVELYVGADGNVEGSKVYHSYYNKLSTCVKTLPDITAKRGEYIIVHLNDSASTDDEDDGTGDTNGNGYWDVYSAFKRDSGWGVSGSDGALWVTETDGETWEDFIIYADQNESTYYSATGDGRIIYSSAAYYGQWSPEEDTDWDTEDYESNCFDSSDHDSGVSIQRFGSDSGDPVDTDSNADWQVAATSQGEGYFLPVSISGTLKVENSPFFPREDVLGEPVEGKITYKLPSSDYYLNLTIYDVKGYPRRYIMRHELIASSQGTLAWDGYDESGSIVPVGIYIVHLRAEHVSTGRIKEAQQTIIVGRKL
ncbi:MAG: hypothetical protein JXJ19_02410 [Elusimicrobia bacterium]|nr:hypothetical protein [Elusimicrobiota bacterium]